MELSITVTVPFFGLQLKAEIDGGYLHGEFDPSVVYLDTLAGQTGQRQWQMSQIGQYLPTPADVSDFYCAHAEAIDAAVAAELADHAEAAADTYEAQRQDEIDDAAERARS
jgi:hypothetical protein